jgi:alpha-beta hydrolase superfamily lysophospholipase
MIRWTLRILLAGSALYLATGAWLLRFAMASQLFPRSSAFNGPLPDSVERVRSVSGNEFLIRRYGKAQIGCVVFFPGQHGYDGKYDAGPYTSAGLEVLLLAYPGQNGASGKANLEEIEDLAHRTVLRARESCPENRVVLLGVSLGAMLAAYASRDADLAGLVLVATAPSLSEAIRVRLASRWYLMPLSILPLSQILPHDYNLTESLLQSRASNVTIFQGTEDRQVPISSLDSTFSRIQGLRVVRVPGGTHSSTFSLSRDAQISVIAGVLSQRPAPSGPAPDVN